MKQRLLASAAMILIGSGIYAASTYYVPTPANETIAEQFPVAPLSLWTSGMNLPDARENLRNVEEESGQNGIPTPSPEVLNFVQYFPEDADESDPAQSYGGRIFQRLLKKDGAWINSIYSYASQTPQQLAVRLGLSRERILGAYDPENEAHQRDSPDSWVIPYFQDIRVNVQDGDGNPISMYFNGKEIMSLANVYTFFQDSNDPELWEDYCMKLWDRSHSLSVSMSEIYYCDSCVEDGREEGESANVTGFVDNLFLNENASKGEETPEDQGGSENEAFVDNSDAGKRPEENEKPAEKNGLPEITGFVDNQSTASDPVSQETPADGGAAGAGVNDGSDNHPNQDGSFPDDQDESLSENSHRQDAQKAGYSAEETGSVDNSVSALSVFDADSAEDTYPQSLQTASASDISLAEYTDTTTPERLNAMAVKDEPSQCPGHIDLVINMKVLGLDDDKGLFEADLIGNKKEQFREKGWQGWLPSARESAKRLAGQDWFQKYGLSLADESISLCTPLPESEIHNYMEQLPPGLSENQRKLVRFALESVGRVPYYWGGKASAPGYEGNHFGMMAGADTKGRVLKGLDCSGWISWVYWSVTGRHLPQESTDGLTVCGTRISREELQPGDILVRTGQDAHAVMFLEWAGDNQIRCVHESSAGTNNVTIAVREADWPYYIRLVE